MCCSSLICQATELLKSGYHTHKVCFPLHKSTLSFVCLEAFLFALNVPSQTEIQVLFGFPDTVAACLDNVSTPSVGLVCNSCMLLLYIWVQSEVAFHPCRPPATFALFSAHWYGPFLSLGGGGDHENQPVLDPSSLQYGLLIPEQSCSSEVQGCDAAIWLNSLLSGSWTPPFMVIVVKDAPEFLTPNSSSLSVVSGRLPLPF